MDDDQQFCLRWNNHQSTLVAVFDTLLENGTLVDCTLAAEGKYLNAHKVVLSACSPYFESLLSQNYDKHPIFILKDVKFQELKAMMDYMYRGEVNISQDQLGALLKAAESLQIKGLSDNKKDAEPRKAAPPPVSKSPPPSALPRVQGLTIEQRRANRSTEDRDGSQSPGPRKRKRMRRRSTDDLDNHDASNSSESHSNPPIQNIPIALPPPASSKMLTEVPEPIETKSDILRHKEPEIAQVPIIKEKIETHTELMLEPKAEYIDEMNEDSIEDLTLDDDDVSNLDMSNDGAGPSHGNMGDGSGQGFAGWHMGNQNQDEVFLAAQEAVGAHRDNQEQSLQDGGIEEKLSEIQAQVIEIANQFSNINGRMEQIERLDKIIDLLNTKEKLCTDVTTSLDIAGFGFPLKTPEEIEKLEEALTNSEFRARFIKKFSQVCGTSGILQGNKVGLILSNKLFKDELLQKYTWRGIAGKNKLCFHQNIKLREAIYSIINMADHRFTLQMSDSFLQNSAIKHSTQRVNRQVKKASCLKEKQLSTSTRITTDDTLPMQYNDNSESSSSEKIVSQKYERECNN